MGETVTAPNFFKWWLIDEPRYLWLVTRVITQKTATFFSVGILIRTLFAPWKRDVQRTHNLPIDLAFRALIDNLVSRFVGFCVRTVTIFVAGGALLVSFLGGLIIIFAEIAMPLIVFLLIIWGLGI